MIIKKIKRTSCSSTALGKTAYDLPVHLVLVLQKLNEKYKNISLERETYEDLPISDILTPNKLNTTLVKKDAPFNPKQKNPIKSKKRTYTKPVRVTKPSEHEPLTKWKNTKDVNKWLGIDFLGYYLYKYNDYYGFEDSSFVGSKWTKSGKTKGKLNNFMMAVKVIDSFNDFMIEMEYGKQKTKEYIDYVFDKWLKNNLWYKADITAYKIFGVGNNYLFGQYFKEVLNKKKKKSSYNPMGVVG